MVITFSVNPPFQVIFVCISLQGFPLLRRKPAELPHPSSRVDLFLTWEPGIRAVQTSNPSAQHPLAGRSVNPSEGEGGGAGGRMRDHKSGCRRL